ELTAKLFAEVWFLSTGHLQQQSYAVERKKFLTTRCSLELRGRILDPQGRALD
ncbi:unnamed protein product, partial [Effrenium voratum]